MPGEFTGTSNDTARIFANHDISPLLRTQRKDFVENIRREQYRMATTAGKHRQHDPPRREVSRSMRESYRDRPPDDPQETEMPGCCRLRGTNACLKRGDHSLFIIRIENDSAQSAAHGFIVPVMPHDDEGILDRRA